MVRKAIGCRFIWSLEIQKGPGDTGALEKNRIWEPSSDSHYVLGLQTLGSLLHLEFHLRAFIQGSVAVRLDSRKMNEHVIAAGTLDESISLGSIKPLHNAFFFHYIFS